MRDSLTPFVIEGAAIRGALVDLSQTTSAILAAHDYPPALARAMTELLAAAALMASTLKLKGSLVVQMSGDGPVRLLVVECNDALELRATAQWSAEATAALPPMATLRCLAGNPANSRLVLTLDPRDAGTLYQGIVMLQGDSISASLEHYMATSEQLASRLVVVVRGSEARGVLLQRMPGSGEHEQATWEHVAGALDRASSALPGASDAAQALSELFPGNDIRMFDSRPATFHCRCSRQRAENALRVAGLAEIEAAIAESGEVDVACEFCNRRYVFTPAQAQSLFASDTSSTH